MKKFNKIMDYVCELAIVFAMLTASYRLAVTGYIMLSLIGATASGMIILKDIQKGYL